MLERLTLYTKVTTTTTILFGGDLAAIRSYQGVQYVMHNSAVRVS